MVIFRFPKGFQEVGHGETHPESQDSGRQKQEDCGQTPGQFGLEHSEKLVL